MTHVETPRRRQQLILERLSLLVRTTGCCIVVSRTEWNGRDAVCPTDGWLECDGTRLDLGDLGWAWGQGDLDVLESVGFLRKLCRQQDPHDPFESSTFYIAGERVEDATRETASLLEAARLLLCNPANELATSRWKDSAAAQEDVAGTIRQLREGMTPEVAAWFAPGGDLRRVGVASGWGEVGAYLTERFQRTDLVASWKRRTAIFDGVAIASVILLLILFLCVIGLPPNPISENVNDWFLVRRGSIDTQEIVWLSLLFFVLVGIPALLGLLLLASWMGGVKYAGRQLDALAMGSKRPSKTVPEGRRPVDSYRRRAAAAVAALSAAAAGLLFLFDRWDSAIEPAVVVLGSASTKLRDAQRHVEIHATALRDLRSAIRERTTGAGMLTDTRTWFSGIGRDVEYPSSHDDRIVPLARAGWRPDEAIDLFWRCGCDDSELDGDRRGSVSIRGTLHRRALPLFVVNSYRRAGFVVADPYYVLEPEASSPSREFRRWAVLVIGLLCATFLLAWPLLAGAARRWRRRGDGSPGS
jgi:hypothetical protein